MSESNETGAALATLGHQMSLRQLQEAALESLYFATGLAGLGLIVLGIHLGFDYPQAWQQLWVGFPLCFLAYPAHRLLAGRYLARTWVLVAFWLGGAVVALVWQPGGPVSSLLVFPVALAALLISTRAGALTGLIVTLILVAVARANPMAVVTASAVIWGLLTLIWLTLRPLYEAFHWSWTHYEEARRQVSRSRDTQAELKQALKDLAEAGVQAIRLNQLLGAARRAAEEAERAKAEFVANVSHELRTPLNMIIGFTEMIMRSPQVYGPDVPPALLADLGVVHRNSEHLSNLIDDVLDLSQIEAGRMALTRERVTLAEIIEAAVVAVQPLFVPKGLYLKTDVPADLPLLYCDRTRLREVVLNLLSNAGRFTAQGGVHIRAWQEGAELVVSVADTGPGIAASDKDRLFRPFEQLKGSIRRLYGGMGLGLAISKRFVELHGGQMWVESQEGAGATFYFRLPIDPPGDDGSLRWLNPDWEYRQRPHRPALPAAASHPRLVVMETNGALQRLLSRYLDDVEIVPVSSLPEALDEMARMPAQALLCNEASVGNALQSLNAAALPEGVPAILCSLPGSTEAAEALGVAEYLVKPVSRDRLLGALERMQIREGTVLIVDDEPEARRLFWRMLASTGRDYRVLTAGSGQEALEILASEQPDVLLLDLVMPEMDGFSLLAACQRNPAWQGIPTLVISARDPLGQPLVSSALAVTRRGGLALHELLACIDAARRILGGGNMPHAAPPAGRAG